MMNLNPPSVSATLQNALEVGVWLVTVQFGGLNQAHGVGGSLATAQRPGGQSD